jgi:zinc protease
MPRSFSPVFALFFALLLACSATGALAARTLHTKTAPKAVPAVAAAQDTHIEGVRFVRLKNGLGVLVKEDDRFPLAHVRMLVHAGSAYETPAQAGISHQLEHMVSRALATWVRARPPGAWRRREAA